MMINNFGYDLPPGVTQSMCEPPNPLCQCGHTFDMHYDDDDIEYNSKGEVVHACDSFNKWNGHCDCTKFTEGYEPDMDDIDD